MDEPFLRLRVLGPTEIKGSRPDVDGASVAPPKRLALLAWLALETADGYRRRDQIVGLFWPDLDQEAARTQLRKALFAIRESLGSDAVLSRGEGEVLLDPAFVWCDAVALGAHMKEGRWAEALALYRGDLLDGLFPEGVGQEFEEWLGDKRKRLREQAAAAAWECSRVEEERGDRKAASVMARRALDLTPDDEEGVRRLMSLLDRHGDRGGALRVYTEWQARLQAEYGVEPAPETRKLARRVQAARKGESHETPPTQQIPSHRPSSAPPVVSSTAAPVSAMVSAPPSEREERVRSPRLIMLGAVTVLVALAAIAVLSLARSGSVDAPPTSVAVLPVRAIGDPGLASAADGIAEELTNALVFTTGLVVRSTARARDVVTGGGDVYRIGRRLGVAYVIDGGVQRSAGRLRLTLRLVRSNDAIAVWAGTYDVDESGMAAIARTVATSADSAIRARLVRSRAAADSPPP